MAQTKRTLSEIYSLLGDNVDRAISPQDLRDAIYTISPDYGNAYISGSATTSLADTVTFVEVAGTYAADAASLDWELVTGTGRLRYLGAANRLASLSAAFSVTSSGGTQVFEIGWGKNGTIHTPSIVEIRTSGSAILEASMATDIEASQNDYFSLMVRNISSATDAIFTKATVSATGFAL